jgi:hypothetical protein
LEVNVKQLAAVIAAAAFIVTVNLAGCAEAPPSSAPQKEVPTGTFQGGDYSTAPNKVQESPVNGTFQGSYTGHANPAPPQNVDTTFRGSYSTQPRDGG